MKYSTTCSIAFALLPAFSAAFPTKRDDLPTADDIAQAVTNWQADTQTVSAFLNFANSVRTAPFTVDDTFFKSEAQIALDAENNELVHKAILDTFFVLDGGVPDAVTAANSTLVDQGTFGIVVQQLGDLAANGQSVLGDIDTINNDRCPLVLPSIDAYFSAVETFLSYSDEQALLTVPLPSGTSVRPIVCGGPVQFGDIPPFGG